METMSRHIPTQIEFQNKKFGGNPVIRGTRIPVSLILANLADGMSSEEILKEYPTLTSEDIRAALLYAITLVENGSPEAVPS
jgi:uncharacterized protein (DUF433 family)